MQFSKEQREAVTHKEGPAMVLAGPGSGKTTVITHRIKWLIEEQGVDPDHLLVITFTRAAAREMKKRLSQMQAGPGHPPGLERVLIGTFHSVFFMILRYAYRYTSGNIIREEDKRRLVRGLVRELALDLEDENSFLSGVLAEISYVKGEMKDLSLFHSSCCPNEIFTRLYKGYEVRLRSNQLLDFDDMLVMCWQLFKEREDIKRAWQDRFRYIMIDEFQDINRVQYEIVKMLAGDRKNLFIVGDDDQSIYHFRGARPEIMLGFEKDYPGSRRIELGINYRCSKEIVERAAGLIAHNSRRFKKNLRSAGIGETGGKGIGDKGIGGKGIGDKGIGGKGIGSKGIGDKRIGDKRIGSKGTGSKGTGSKRTGRDQAGRDQASGIGERGVVLLQLKDGSEECADILSRIRSLHKQGIAYRDMAVIYRTNTQPGLLARILFDHNIPFRMRDLLPNLFEHWIAGDLINYLLLAAGDRSRRRFLQVMNRPCRYISRDMIREETVDFAELKRQCFGRSWLYERVDQMEMDLILLARMEPYAAIRFIRSGIGYDDYLAEYAASRKMDPYELPAVLDQIQETSRPFHSTKEWFAYINEYSKELRKQKEAGRKGVPRKGKEGVTLTTMHSAKGLEYDVVFIMDLNEGVVPHKKAVTDTDMEEERRLLYVALTRARIRLFLYTVKEVYHKETAMSRFLAEIFPDFGGDCSSLTQTAGPNPALRTLRHS